MRDVDGRRLLFHGAVVLLVGLLAGLPLATAIADGWGEESVRAWRVAHTGLVGGGVTLIAIAGAIHHVQLGVRAGAWLVWSLVVTVYAAVIALGLGPILGVRGLQPTFPFGNLLVFAANVGLAIGAFIGTVLLIGGARGGRSGTGA